jgi:hypothetical protein
VDPKFETLRNGLLPSEPPFAAVVPVSQCLKFGIHTIHAVPLSPSPYLPVDAFVSAADAAALTCASHATTFIAWQE